MRTLTTALATQLGLTVTRPGYLVELGFNAGTMRLSTMGDVTYNGNTFTGADVRVARLSWQGNATNSGQLTLGNADNAFSSFLLSEGVAGKSVKVWAVYAGANSDADVVLLFNGQGKIFTLADTGYATVEVVTAKSGSMYAPRTFINKAGGFNFLDPAGKVYLIGGQRFTLERQVL